MRCTYRATATAPIVFAFTTIIAGCHKQDPVTLGTAPGLTSTASVKQLTSLPPQTHVTLSGEMIEKCPVSGCWFVLKDKSGVVHVNTKSSGFVVAAVPLHSQVTVSGTIGTGQSKELEATGVRY